MVVVFGGMLVPFVVLTALDQQQYFLPAAFATLFAAMCDPRSWSPWRQG